MNRLLVLLLIASSASAGTVLNWERARTDETNSIVMKCEGGNARFESNGGKAAAIVIYLAKTKTLTVMNPAAKTYVQMDQSTMSAARDRASATKERMKAQLEKAAPEQRAQLEALLNAEKDVKPLPEWSFKSTGKKLKVGSFDCELFDGSRGETRVELCLVPWEKAPVKRADLECARGVAEMFKSMGPAVAADGDSTREDLTKFPGLPVLSSRDVGEGRKITMTLKGAAIAPVSPDEFVIPPGYELNKSRTFGGQPPPAPAQ